MATDDPDMHGHQNSKVESGSTWSCIDGNQVCSEFWPWDYCGCITSYTCTLGDGSSCTTTAHKAEPHTRSPTSKTVMHQLPTPLSIKPPARASMVEWLRNRLL